MADVPHPGLTLIGWLETPASVALVIPGVSGMVPSLTIVVAASLVVLMVCAFIFHRLRHEYPNIALNSILLGLGLIVAHGRVVYPL